MKATDLSYAPTYISVARGVDKTPGGARWRARDLQSFGCRDDGSRARALDKRLSAQGNVNGKRQWHVLSVHGGARRNILL